MTGLAILDVVIGLAFVYLLLALICTTFMEWIAQLWNLRGRMLESGTRRLLGEEAAADPAVTKAYFDHPLVRTLKDGERMPSYVPGTVFAKAVTETLRRRAAQGGDDGDIHFSGVSSGIGLPFVAEVVNAGLAAQRPAVQAIVAAEENDGDIQIGGAWRLWFEHPAKQQTQGGSNPFEPDHTNPDHSFEIHPASRINQLDLTGSFIPIAGYTAYAADVAFPYFDQRKVTIKASSSGISLRSGKLRYNYVEFDIELTHDPAQVQDGYIALATVLDDNGDEVAAGPRRMIFVAGTRGAEVMRTAAAGDRFRVLGIPRVNLSAVLGLLEQHGTQQFEAALPYEMIVVGVM